jgi:O-antigen/teichoic acid export membrane protein
MQVDSPESPQAGDGTKSFPKAQPPGVTMGRAISNSIWNVAGLFVSVMLTFFAAPLVLRILGADKYGIFMLLTAILAPLGLANLSLGQATIKYVAEAQGRGNMNEAGTYVRTTLLFNIGVGVLGSALIALLAHKLVVGIFNITPADQALARNCLYWIAAGWSVSQISTTFNAVPVAMQRYDLVSVGTILFTILNTGLGVAVLLMGYGLLTYVEAFFACQVLGTIGWLCIARRLMPGIRLFPAWEGSAFRRSFRFGFWQTISQVGGLAANQTDKYVLGILMPMSAVGMYNIALKVEQNAYLIVYKMSEVLFPTFSHLQGQDNKKRESMAVMRSSWLLSMLASTILVPVIIWSQDFMRLWVGALVAADTYRVLQVITLAGLLGSGTSVGIFYLMGIGKTNWSAVTSVLTGIVVLAGSLLLIPRLGLLGAGWGNVLSMFVRVGVVSAMWHVFFKPEMRWLVYVSAVYGPTLIGLFLGAGFLTLKSHLHLAPGWIGLVLYASGTAVIIGLAIIAVDNFLPGGRIRHNDVMRIAGHIAAVIGRPPARWFKLDYR